MLGSSSSNKGFDLLLFSGEIVENATCILNERLKLCFVFKFLRRLFAIIYRSNYVAQDSRLLSGRSFHF